MGERQQYCMKWNNFTDNMVVALDNLREEEDFVDVTIACDGASIKAHKVILSACSLYFRRLLKENPCQHPIVILRDVHQWEMQAILAFMYNGQVMVEEDRIPQLLRTAELLEVRGLADVTKKNDPSEEVPDHQPNAPKRSSELCYGTPPPNKKARPIPMLQSILNQSVVEPTGIGATTGARAINTGHIDINSNSSNSSSSSGSDPAIKSPEAQADEMGRDGEQFEDEVKETRRAGEEQEDEEMHFKEEIVEDDFEDEGPEAMEDGMLEMEANNGEDALHLHSGMLSQGLFSTPLGSNANSAAGVVMSMSAAARLKAVVSQAQSAKMDGGCQFSELGLLPGMLPSLAGVGPTISDNDIPRKLAFHEPRPCPVCRRIYRDAATLRTHTAIMHTESNDPFICSCGALFRTKFEMYVHRKNGHK